MSTTQAQHLKKKKTTQAQGDQNLSKPPMNTMSPILQRRAKLRCSCSEESIALRTVGLASDPTTIIGAKWPFIVELDCSDDVRMINNVVEERSEQTFMVKEIHHLLRERLESKVVGIRREQNLVSDALAKMARTDRTTAVWLRSGPSLISRLCNEDCNSGV
jgi:hypothetical protein